MNKLFIILLILFSCNKKVISTYQVDENSWSANDSIIFDFNISDTVSTYNLSFFIRNTLDFEYRNIFLLINTNYNNATIKKDTVEYAITNKSGQWLGRGFGDMKDNYLIFEENLIFNNTGQYELSVKHGMRSEPLIGINTFGFKLNKNEN
ncbi:MAG: hypothetical protein CMP49_00410 [Flavobacteriales bacterium]|nr:hypothetical protein [Flavobacteriales bacterium]|tara:strand:+ start:10860 stop:11309 length:450 start_codon:yes stop_codon:yes gene_type:complete